ncbi:MAG: alpha-ketoacid dehydrogenase subunit beta [Dehalococcoidia bacterium]|nr:alpha-ketoacid dehydrogenase subunit beta [Dehalococcoidia bacterium]
MTTTTATRQITYGEAEREALREEMRRDPNVIIMGEDIAGAAGRPGFTDAWGGPFGSTKGLIQEFGAERVRDTPISEAGFIGAAVGAAATGMRPVADLMFIDFIGCCLDQIMNNAAKMRYMFGGKSRMPLTIMTRIGAGVGSAAQHSETLYSMLTHLPGLKVVAPSDAYTAKGLLISAIRDDDPVIVCDHKRLLGRRGPVPEEAYTWPIGKARVLKPGKDVTLVGISLMTGVCLDAAAALAKEGVDAEVIDLLSLSPLDDEAILTSVKKTQRLVVVDEDTPRCSLATDIAALVADEAFDYLAAPVKRITAPHTPVPFSRVLEQAYIPNAQRVVDTVKGIMG